MPYTALTNVGGYDALLSSIRTFCAANGWTVERNEPPITGSGAGGNEVILSNGDCLVGLRSTTIGAGADRLYMFDGVPPYDAADEAHEMGGSSGITYDNTIITSAGTPGARHLQTAAGPFPTAHLFSDDPGTYCHVAVEVSAGIWKHLFFGNLHKFGTWTGGAYYGCTYWELNSEWISLPSAAVHNIPFATNGNAASREWTVHYQYGSDRWIAPTETTVNGVVRWRALGSARGGFGHPFYQLQETPFSGLVSLGPIVVASVRSADTPDTLRWIGQVPDLRLVNITNFSPNDVLTIGSDQWRVYPFASKNGAAGQINSGMQGFAFKVIP